MRYDPNLAVDAETWLELDEGERIVLAENYHRRADLKAPNEKLHAVIHTIVENQAALGGEYSVAAKLQQLMDEGLNRHDAVHAIGSVLAEHMFEVMGGGGGDDLNGPYLKDLAKLTAKKWLASGE
jgi:hypothetical protein